VEKIYSSPIKRKKTTELVNDFVHSFYKKVDKFEIPTKRKDLERDNTATVKILIPIPISIPIPQIESHKLADESKNQLESVTSIEVDFLNYYSMMKNGRVVHTESVARNLSAEMNDWETLDFVSQEKKDGYIYFPNVSALEYNNLKKLCERKRWNYRLRYLAPELFIKVPGEGHEGPLHVFQIMIGDFNRLLSNRADRPIRSNGAANIKLVADAHEVQPDASFIADQTGRNSNNLVVEIAVAEGYRALLTDLKDYIIKSHDVMISIGIKVFPVTVAGDVPMVFFMYKRNVDNGNPELTGGSPISFGTAALSNTVAQNVFEELAREGPGTAPAARFSGVGHGGGPCNDANEQEYMVELNRDFLTCVDNDGEILLNNVVFNTNDPRRCFLSLFSLQDAIVTGIRRRERK
jgi:hypothetical protein